MGAWGAVALPVFAKFLQNLPFLPQILAFLCLQPLTFQSAPALSNSLRRQCFVTFVSELKLGLGARLTGFDLDCSSAFDKTRPSAGISVALTKTCLLFMSVFNNKVSIFNHANSATVDKLLP